MTGLNHVSRRRNVLFGLIAVCFALTIPTVCRAEEPTSDDKVAELAARIDSLIAARWQEEDVVPAPVADDAEFFRRISLDISGKIPAASAVRDFLKDADPLKRRRAVEQLLSSPSYVIHHTNLWRAAMIPEADTEAPVRTLLPGFEAWLRARIAENKNFAEIVTEILTLPLAQQDLQMFNQPERPTPAAFYAAKQGKPEELAAATARLFLGVRIDCAQCHDHPFDSWKREQFWQFAAFFGGIPRADSPAESTTPDSQKTGTLRIPETDKIVHATFLDGTAPRFSNAAALRNQLADWLTSGENDWFARAAVNRIWSHHFGTGLVEPMDDFSNLNPPSHPELLDALAEAFIASDYDVKFMVQAISATHTYQLTSQQTDPSQDRPDLFARMAVRGLTPEQMFDSLAQATGYRQPFDPEQPLNFNNDPARQEFLATFSNAAESATQRSATILQALSLMNGDFVASATDLTDSRTLAAVIDAPFLDAKEQINALYLATLSRFPDEEEQRRMLAYLHDQRQIDREPEALADIFWVLLNSSEFLLNH